MGAVIIVLVLLAALLLGGWIFSRVGMCPHCKKFTWGHLPAEVSSGQDVDVLRCASCGELKMTYPHHLRIVRGEKEEKSNANAA